MTEPNPHGPMPTTPTAPPLAKDQQGSNHRWVDFLRNLIGILIRPTHTWKRLHSSPPSVAHVLWPHALMLITARAIAEAVGSLAGGQSVGEALKIGLFSAGAWFVLVWILAIITLTVASARHAPASFGHALRFSAFSVTPLLVVGIFAVIPLPYVTQIADALAMPYAFYVLSVGVVPLLQVPQDRAPGAVGLLTGALLVGWVLIPTLLRIGLTAIAQP